MLAYAADRPRVADRPSSPNAMVAVICAHVAVAVLVMSAKMVLPHRVFDPPTSIVSVPLPKEPAPAPTPRAAREPAPTTLPQPHSELLPTRVNAVVPLDLNGAAASTTAEGPAVSTALPSIPMPPPAVAISAAPQLLTPQSELKPPYPQSKLLTGEEAALTLRLAIDEHGRVVAVDPVGRADGVFLAAARSYLLTHWRYRPAMQDGSAVASSIVITLRFELED